MINVNDVLRINEYDHDLAQKTNKRYVVLQIFPHHVYCRNVKAGYHSCFNAGQLIENGYIPNFDDVLDEPHPARNSAHYGAGNKLLQGYCV